MTSFNGTQVTGALRLLRRQGDAWSDSGVSVPYDAPSRLLVPQFRGNVPKTGALKDWKNSDVAAFASLSLWDVATLKNRFMARPLAGMPLDSMLWERGDGPLLFVAPHIGLLSCVDANGKELWRFVVPGTLGAQRNLSQLASTATADRVALPGGSLVLFRWASQHRFLLVCLSSELRAAWCLDVTNPERPAFRWYREDLPEKRTPLLWGQASWSGEKLPGAFPVPPVVAGQKIYAASEGHDGAVVEINPLNGDSRICCQVPDPVATSPVALLDRNQNIKALFFCDVKGRFYRCQRIKKRWTVELLQDLFSLASFDGTVEPQLMVQQKADGTMNFIVTAHNDSHTALWSVSSASLSDKRWTRWRRDGS